MSTAGSTAAVTFDFFEVRVARVRQIGSCLRRITFTGPGLTGFASGGRDQRVKLFLPAPGQERPLVPTEAGPRWYRQWRAMDPTTRAIMRSYTIRAQRRDPDEIDIDFVVHHPAGPASRWAAAARPGEPVLVLGPLIEGNAGVDFRPPPQTGWVLLAGDETALPAISGILDWLPAELPAYAFIEVAQPADREGLRGGRETCVTWLPRSQPGAAALPEVVRAAALPDVTSGYAWIAGESGQTRQLRRHLIGERGFDRARITFTGYWRRGATEEDLIAEFDSGSAPTDD